MINKNRIIRILTFISFFNFSGLNNGWTTLIVSSGKIQNISFAPVVFVKCAQTLNPANWKKTILDPMRQKFFPKPTRIIEFASQRTVHTLLINSSLFQIWVETIWSGNLNPLHKDSINKHPTTNSSIRSKAETGKNLHNLIRHSPSYQTDHSTNYFEKVRKELWLRNEKRETHRINLNVNFLVMRNHVLNTVESKLRPNQKVKRPVLSMFEKLKRFTFGRSNSNDDDLIYSKTFSNRLSRSDVTAGLFFDQSKTADKQVLG